MITFFLFLYLIPYINDGRIRDKKTGHERKSWDGVSKQIRQRLGFDPNGSSKPTRNFPTYGISYRKR